MRSPTEQLFLVDVCVRGRPPILVEARLRIFLWAAARPAAAQLLHYVRTASIVTRTSYVADGCENSVQRE